MHTLHGVVMAIAEGRKGPAKGGVLDGEQATRLRALLAEHGQGRAAVGKRHRARAGAAAAAKSDRCRAHPVAGADHRSPLRRPVQAPDAGRAAHSGFRLVRASRSRSNWSIPDETDVIVQRPRGAAGMAGGARLPGARPWPSPMSRPMWPPNSTGSPPSLPDRLEAGTCLADLVCSLRSNRLPSMKCQGETHETIRPHRKAARHQARERLELETHLRKDRRLFRGADRRRHPRPDEADQAAGRQCRRVVRAVQIGNRDAQRGADARQARRCRRPIP